MDVAVENLTRQKRIALGTILGTIPSDGYFGLTDKNLFNYILCSKDREFIELIAKNFSKFGVEVRIHRRKSGLWYIEVSRRWFDAFVSYLKREEGGWIFSALVTKSTHRDFQSAIIRSFADAEGTATCKIRDGKYFSRRIAIYNKSIKLLFQLQSMLESFGINSYARLDRNARVTKVRNQTANFPAVYSLRITNHRNLKIFYDLIGFGIPRKMKILENMLNSYKRIGNEYFSEDYHRVLNLYHEFSNCREVSRTTGFPAQTIQNWVLYEIKPRILKIKDREER